MRLFRKRSGGDASRPNILLIQADQHRYDCAAPAASEFAQPARTPALARLAQEGTWFTQAYCPTPICCPARQSLLCGQWPETHGGLWNYDHGLPLAPFKAFTWPQALAQAGYSLAWFGKWHEGAGQSPLDYGYTEYISGKDYSAWRKRSGLPDYQTDFGAGLGLEREVGRWMGGHDPARLEQAKPAWLAERAIAGIRRLAGGGQPWHVRLNLDEPHLPCFPAEPYASLYRPEEMRRWPSFADPLTDKPYIQRQQLASWGIADLPWEVWAMYLTRYLGMIAQVDEAVGRVLAALDELGLAENTLVIYTSDHGGNEGSHRMMDKHYVMYDDVVRVPLVMRGPGVAAGQRCQAFVSNALDLAATLWDVAGLPVPASVQGRSLRPLLRGETPADWRQEIVATYNGAQFGLFAQRMLRDRAWKYIWNPTDVDELYDLRADPWELANRCGDPACANLLAEQRARLYRQLVAQGDPLVANEWTRGQLLEGHKLGPAQARR